ncbi:MAG: hypothetical protein PHH82_01155 [Candidatus ainarchaeum sp.]|nr:hypothetical protein [Candidatus ainarchaeum sp.]
MFRRLLERFRRREKQEERKLIEHVAPERPTKIHPEELLKREEINYLFRRLETNAKRALLAGLTGALRALEKGEERFSFKLTNQRGSRKTQYTIILFKTETGIQIKIDPPY